MADYTLSPDMNLPVPTVGAAAGPLYADYVNDCLTIIDQHNHAAGSGVQINPSGININADLPFNSNNATLLRTARFAVQPSAITSSAPDQGALYVATVGSRNELFYNDYNGNQVQITAGGTVNATSSGISNGTTAATINGSQELQVATISTGALANITAGSYLMGSSSTGTNVITLQVPSGLSSSYPLVFPALPSSQTQFLTLDTSGNISTSSNFQPDQIASQSITGSQLVNGTITNTQIAANTITGTNIATGTISPTLVDFMIPATGVYSNTYTVTYSGTGPGSNSGTVPFTSNITTVGGGGGILVMLANGYCQFTTSGSGSIVGYGTLNVLKNGSTIHSQPFGAGSGEVPNQYWPLGMFNFIDFFTTGTNTTYGYQIQVTVTATSVSGGTNSISISVVNPTITVMELGG